MYDRILVPLDGSSFGEQVLPLATTIARRTGMGLELVKVHHPQALAFGMDGLPAALDADARDADARVRELSARYLADVAAAVGDVAGLAVRTTIIDDPHPATAICREAERVGATLIAMTTHGRTGMLRTMRGGVTDGVLHHAVAPVLLWRPADTPEPVRATFRHLLVALDGSAWAEMIIPVAAALAEALGARLSLARVVANVNAMVPAPLAVAGMQFAGLSWLPSEVDRPATQRAADRARGYLAEVAAQVSVAHPGLVAGVHAIVEDDVPAGILRAADEADADVLAMTTHARGVSRLVVGSTVDEVLGGRSGATLLLRPTAPAARG